MVVGGGQFGFVCLRVQCTRMGVHRTPGQANRMDQVRACRTARRNGSSKEIAPRALFVCPIQLLLYVLSSADSDLDLDLGLELELLPKENFWLGWGEPQWYLPRAVRSKGMAFVR